MMDGLKIIKTIQSNERYDAYEAELEGQRVFAKKAKTPKTKELISGVAKNSDIVNTLGARTTDFSFRAPKILTNETGWLVTEWIEGKSLDEDVVLHPESVADTLSRFFIVFDNEPVRPKGFRQIFTQDGLEHRMEERIPKNLGAEQKKTLAQAKRLFNKLQPELVPALQDADIKPDHIFNDPQKPGRWVLVDSEHLGPQWPRFYDLSNNFAKFWVRHQKFFSNRLLKTFLDRSGLAGDEIFEHLLAILLIRGISLHWETDYDPGAEGYNIPRAQAMLKICLKARNLEDLLYLSTEDE